MSAVDIGPSEVGPMSATFYRLRCGWCGAYEGTVSPAEPCARDSDTGEYIGPHQFGVYEVWAGPSPEALEAENKRLREKLEHIATNHAGFARKSRAALIELARDTRNTALRKTP